jgi:hypothetical protein
MCITVKKVWLMCWFYKTTAGFFSNFKIGCTYNMKCRIRITLAPWMVLVLLVLLALSLWNCGGSTTSNPPEPQVQSTELLINSNDTALITNGVDTLELIKHGMLDVNNNGYAYLCTLEVTYKGDLNEKRITLQYWPSPLDTGTLASDTNAFNSLPLEQRNFFLPLNISPRGIFDLQLVITSGQDTLMNVGAPEAKVLTGLLFESRQQDQGLIPDSTATDTTATSPPSPNVFISDPVPTGQLFGGYYTAADSQTLYMLRLNSDTSFQLDQQLSLIVGNDTNCTSKRYSGAYVQNQNSLQFTVQGYSTNQSCNASWGWANESIPFSDFTWQINYSQLDDYILARPHDTKGQWITLTNPQ